MTEEAVEPQENAVDNLVEDMQEPVQEHEDVQQEPEGDPEEQAYQKTMIPLSVAQKLRMKNKELELENQWMKQQQEQKQQPQEDDDTQFESATKADLNQSKADIKREIEESIWVKQNPEKYDVVMENLKTFLKQRPNLSSAIQMASNRYEEAFELMDKLTPKQQAQLKREAPAPKKVTPNAPGGVPKAAAMADAVDVMSMSDAEFAKWRQSKKGTRR